MSAKLPKAFRNPFIDPPLSGRSFFDDVIPPGSELMITEDGEDMETEDNIDMITE